MTPPPGTLTRRAKWLLVGAALLLCGGLAHVCVPADAFGLARNPAIVAIIKHAAGAKPELLRTLRELSGVTPAPIGEQRHTLYTRNAGSGVSIDMAEQYVYEHLQADGLSLVRFGKFWGGVDGRNVIGQITGTGHPKQIVVVCAHLDDWADPNPGHAPGANDNGSSVAAVLLLARIFGHYRFDRTVRFVFFGGEEWDLDGSWAFATAARKRHEDLVAVLNSDMIGWNGSGTRRVELHTRPSGRGDRDLMVARLFRDVVRAYHINGIDPRIMEDSPDWSDHWSFWANGFGAACLIEDETTREYPYYHTSHDTMNRFTWPYYLDVVKGLAGTVADLGRLWSPRPVLRVVRMPLAASRYAGWAAVPGPDRPPTAHAVGGLRF